MRNQPKYNFFKNTTYALKGMKELLKTETSFKLELLVVVVLLPLIFILDLELSQKLLMFLTLFLMPLCEAINSSIERVVDLVTSEYHPLAAQAKDIGSAIVFISICLFVLTWGVILGNYFLTF